MNFLQIIARLLFGAPRKPSVRRAPSPPPASPARPPQGVSPRVEPTTPSIPRPVEPLRNAAPEIKINTVPAQPAGAPAEFPPPPAYPPIDSEEGRQKLFGKFAWRDAPSASDPQAIEIQNPWPKENIRFVRLPMDHIPPPPERKGKPYEGMHFNRYGAAQLEALWAEWQEQQLLPLVMSFHGDWVPRYQRPTEANPNAKVLSNHSYGSAFDINYAANKLGRGPAALDTTGCVRRLVPIANKYGFYWGGHFSRRDGMHFELARIISPEEVARLRAQKTAV